MPRATVIRHVAFEDLDAYAEVLRAHGYQIDYLEAGIDSVRSPQTAKTDLLVVLGGPLGANDTAEFPFLVDEIGFIEDRIRTGQQVLGICLGAQLMARALGARVYPARQAEIGWMPLHLTAEGESSCLRHLAGIPVLHWHGDTFELPDDAQRLASTAICENQAFAYGKHALALQFHTEVSAPGVERWLIGHVEQIRRTPGISVSALRSATAEHTPRLVDQSRRLLLEWLDDQHSPQP